MWNEARKEWETSVGSHETGRRWRDKQKSFVTYDSNNKPLFNYVVAGRTTCGEYCRVAYGIPDGTWKANRAALREPGAMDVNAEMSAWDAAARKALKKEETSSTNECVNWWLMIFPLWDAIPNEFLIKHPRLIWERLYDLYFAEISTYGACPPLTSKTNKAPGAWYTARTEALRRYSIKHFGLKELPADSTKPTNFSNPEPKAWFKLRARPDHSNYPECAECRDHRLEVERLVTEKAPRADINKVRDLQLKHVQNMFAERDVCAELENEAHRSTTTVFELDDKLGSHWQFLPMPQNERLGKKTAGNWRYRQCLQGNSFPGVGNFLSVVPPMLRTGANFGCSAFCYSLYRLIEVGKIDSRVKRIVRQTDGGSNNVAWITHGVHYMLVHEGVFDQIDWIRLEPGHSHNPQVGIRGSVCVAMT
eukprot:4378463-Pleurochrysis_carterae.AAC.1